MSINKLSTFITDISKVEIPKHLNNPFGSEPPEISRIAAVEFQAFIESAVKFWEYDFSTRKGKMFGVLVVQTADQKLAYLRAVSGRLSRHTEYEELVPSIFDDSSEDYFINKGMTAVTEFGTRIKNTNDKLEKASLIEERRLKSIEIQQKLFDHYNFINISGQELNLLDVFKKACIDKPPSAAGECAAPKLLQYAFKNKLRPIAIAEFWWGRAAPNNYRVQKNYYPACTDKCKPILEYMLDDDKLYDKRDI